MGMGGAAPGDRLARGLEDLNDRSNPRAPAPSLAVRYIGHAALEP
jgi:hypothetical protein